MTVDEEKEIRYLEEIYFKFSFWKISTFPFYQPWDYRTVIKKNVAISDHYIGYDYIEKLDFVAEDWVF